MIKLDPFQICSFERNCEFKFLPIVDPLCGRLCQGLNPNRRSIFTCELHPSLEEEENNARNDGELSSYTCSQEERG